MLVEVQLSKQAGRFQVSRVLGTGGSGVVYAARDGEHAIALKLLRDGLVASERAKRQFIREAEAMARVAHPALVRVLEAGELPDGQPYLCMPLLEGETLAARLDRGAFSLDAALVVFEKLAGAVAAIHEKGLVHRDIKPENVFMTAEDEPVLLDLGLAREAGSSLTTTGVVTGTRAYMAPERFFGRAATVASDVYELALVLYLMLTGGDLPWTDDSDPQARLNPAPLEARLASSPRAARVSAAVARALSPRPELRFTSVRELLADVRRPDGDRSERRVTEDLPVIDAPEPRAMAPAASATTPDRASRGRRTVLLSAAASVLVASALLLVFGTRSSPVDARASAAAPTASPRAPDAVGAPSAEVSNDVVSPNATSTVNEPAPVISAAGPTAAPARPVTIPRPRPIHPRAAPSAPARATSVPADDRRVYEHR